MSDIKNAYASSAALRRAITTCKKAGLQVGSVKLHPDGAIELIRDALTPSEAVNDFDRLEAAGLL